MKYILLLLLISATHQVYSQDWSIRTKNRSRWTANGIEGKREHLDTAFKCTITKRGDSITFAQKFETYAIRFLDTENFPQAGYKPLFPLDPKDGPCICYHTRQLGDMIYWPKAKKVMRIWPGEWKYLYY